jgi:hypothetical protein
MPALLSAIAAAVNTPAGLVVASLASGCTGVWVHLALVLVGG